MGGDDFQKKDSGLGLRDAITNERQLNDDKAAKGARELFITMDVIKRVRDAIGEGHNQVLIEFSGGGIYPNDQYVGEITWQGVVTKFCQLIKDEGVAVALEVITDYNPGPHYREVLFTGVVLTF